MVHVHVCRRLCGALLTDSQKWAFGTMIGISWKISKWVIYSFIYLFWGISNQPTACFLHCTCKPPLLAQASFLLHYLIVIVDYNCSCQIFSFIVADPFSTTSHFRPIKWGIPASLASIFNWFWQSFGEK